VVTGLALACLVTGARAGDSVMVLAWNGRQYDVLRDAGHGFQLVASHGGFIAAPIGVYDWSDEGVFVGLFSDLNWKTRLVTIDPQGRLKYSALLPSGLNVHAVFHSALPHHVVAVLGPPRCAVAIIEKATGAMLELYKVPAHPALYPTMYAYDIRRHRLYWAGTFPSTPAVAALFESEVLTGKTRPILTIPGGFNPRNAAVEPITGALAFGVYGGPGVENFGALLYGQLVLNMPVTSLKSVAAGPRDVTIRSYAFVTGSSVVTLALQRSLVPTVHPLPPAYVSVRAVGLKR
jgi:hypothetical protein